MLTVSGYIKKEDTWKKGAQKTYLTCVCECGNIVELGRYSLLHKRHYSCGCFRKIAATKHGKHGSKIYDVYNGIKSRCYNKNSKNYPRYGGAGVTMCDEWLTNFDVFYKWCDLKELDGKKQIDRIDPSKGYSPDNCRVVTPSQNTYNKNGHKNSSSRYKGVSKIETVSTIRWCARIKINGVEVRRKTFNSEEEAASNYNEWATELFGEYARLNVISRGSK